VTAAATVPAAVTAAPGALFSRVHVRPLIAPRRGT